MNIDYARKEEKQNVDGQKNPTIPRCRNTAKVNKGIESSNAHYNIPSIDEKIITLPNPSKASFESDEEEKKQFGQL